MKRPYRRVFALLIVSIAAVVSAIGLWPPAAAMAQDCAVDTPLDERVADADIVALVKVINVTGRTQNAAILQVQRVFKGPEDLENIVGVAGYHGSVACGSEPFIDQVAIFFMDGSVESGLQASYVNGGDAIAPGDSGTQAAVAILMRQAESTSGAADDPLASFDPDAYGIVKPDRLPAGFAVFVGMTIALAVLVWGRLLLRADNPF